jgi:hypothetical protein
MPEPMITTLIHLWLFLLALAEGLKKTAANIGAITGIRR